ncbi:MAG: ABC transporter permease subunit [Candidatus Thermoplasmatota archaeon]|jgi:NitT/TauT family transport system permease protein|nr:ABC transporter permease subunit [Candidatus Thermoplasmatota archaeon]MDA8143883.1 ABC transporter permease subunit [Thermoplasmatales archaeon]
MGFYAGDYILIVFAIIATFLRIWFLMLLSIGIALVLGVFAARVKSAGAIIIPITDILEAVPVISFFPIILVFFIERIGGFMGVELASDFLIITALLWNIILGVYEATTHIPEEYFQLSEAYDLGLISKIRNLYMPAAYPHIISNIMPSFSSGLFYITLSEVISIGSENYTVFGVGSLAVQFAATSSFFMIGVLILFLMIAIALNYYFIINPLILRAHEFAFDTTSTEEGRKKRETNVFVSAIGSRITHVLSSRVGALYLTLNGSDRNSAEKPRRRIRISEKQLNLLAGVILLSLTGIAVLVAADTGFTVAFLEYLTNTGTLFQLAVATGFDLLRILIVFLFSFIAMVPIAMYFGRRGRSGRFGTGIFQIIYSIPAPILFPVIVEFLTPNLAVYIGSGMAYEFDVLLVTFLSAAAYIFFNVYGAAVSIPRELEVITQTYSIKGWKKTKYLTFPGIIPGLITGSMAAFGSYWGGLMVGEYTRVGGKTYSVDNGLMLLIDKGIATGNLIFVDAIDLFMVFIIVLITYFVWMRLYRYSQKRFSA